MMECDPVAEKVGGWMARARRAQQAVEFATQEKVDEITTRVAWAAVQPDFARQLAETLVAESGMGEGADKVAKIMTKVRGTLRDMKGRKSAGVVFEDPATGIRRLAKPVGVIGAILPVTNGEATPLVKILCALKTRNAILLAPHPKAQKTCDLAVARVRALLRQQGWPEDLVIGIAPVSVEISRELMRQCDLVIATGGPALVQAAHTSGTPSYGVGAGNAVCLIDETADAKDAAHKIMQSKTFDHATSCSAENALAIQESIYETMMRELEAAGGYCVTPEEKIRLQAVLWDPEKNILNRAAVARPAGVIATLAGIRLPEGKRFLLVPETGVGPAYPFSGEKLSVTLAVYRWKTFEEALELADRILAHSGAGHSCGIHTTSDARVLEMARRVKVSRIMVRQPQSLASSGAWTNGMPMSLTLGCGTWGGNISSSNITWEHMLNYTWVSCPIPAAQPTDEELFGGIIQEGRTE